MFKSPVSGFFCEVGVSGYSKLVPVGFVEFWLLSVGFVRFGVSGFFL